MPRARSAMQEKKLKRSQDGIPLKAGMGDSTGAPGAYPVQTTDHRILRVALRGSHWRQSRTPGSLTLESVTTKHKSLHWARNRHLPMVGLPTLTGQAGKTESGDFFHLRQGLLPGHSGMEGVSSRILFEPSWSKKQETTTFHIFLVLVLWQLLKYQWNSCLAQLHLRGRG